MRGARRAAAYGPLLPTPAPVLPYWAANLPGWGLRALTVHFFGAFPVATRSLPGPCVVAASHGFWWLSEHLCE
jgi:hypothetical protein